MAAIVPPDPARWFTQHLRARAASLLAEYRVASGFEHKLLRGLEREAPIRRFLLEHCPLRVLVASGSVADASRVLDRQHDIVLIDAAFGPTLLAGSAAGLFPVESVFGIIEAKSGPDLELDTVANSLLEVRGLSAAEGVARHGETIEPGKTGPGLHVVVAFKGPAPRTTAARLEAANNNAAESQRLPIDLVLVLSRNGVTLDGCLQRLQENLRELGTFFSCQPSCLLLNFVKRSDHIHASVVRNQSLRPNHYRVLHRECWL